ncbi:unnamed protein product [Rhizophagus irregularis]|nr:unnamed protein product [Rhizophagus irregularis]
MSNDKNNNDISDISLDDIMNIIKKYIIGYYKIALGLLFVMSSLLYSSFRPSMYENNITTMNEVLKTKIGRSNLHIQRKI